MIKYLASILLLTSAAVAHDGNLHAENTIEENMEILKWRTDTLLLMIQELEFKLDYLLQFVEEPNDC